MKKIITICCVLSAFLVQAQLAIIQDKDGFTNLRAEPSMKGEILTKMLKHQVFWDMTEIFDDKENSDWVGIQMGEKLDTLTQEETYQEATFFMAKNRVLHLDKLPKIANKSIVNQTVILKNNDYDIKITKRKYSKKVNFKNGHGVDGAPPKEEIQSVSFTYKGVTIQLNPKYCNAFFEPNFENTDAYLDNEDYLYLVMNNSDGAGGYSVVWIFEKTELKDIVTFKRF
jgi:hypothetical protein